MFCKNCGTQLKTDDKFCPSCGLATDSNTEAPKTNPASTNNINFNANVHVKEIVPLLKGMIIHPLATIKNGAKSLSKESSLILAGIILFLFSLINTLCFKSIIDKAFDIKARTNNMFSDEIFGDLLGETKKVVDNTFSAPKFFFYTLLGALIFSAILILCVFIVSKLINKEEFNIIHSINCVSLSATLLLAFILCAFICFYISAQLGIFILGIANIVFVITLFTGFKSLIAKNDSILVYLYAVAMILANYAYVRVMFSFLKTSIQNLVNGRFNF